MKNLLLIAFALILLAGGSAFAQGIAGTDHDLSAVGTSNEICVYCHTPHNGSAQTPLWNRGDPGGDYQPYDSPTLDAAINGDIGVVSGVSKMCLSCHDGATALGNVVVGDVGLAATTIAAGGDLFSDGMTNDHPVSFTYDQPLVDDDGALKTIVQATPYLYAGKVECASCHDVHDSAGLANFLVESNASSALCLKCHIK